MIPLIVGACCVCGVIGYFVGWVTTIDRQDRRAEPAPVIEAGSIVTARESDEFWEGVYAGGHARTSPLRIGNMSDPVALAREASYLAVQAPLGELVQPHSERTTDFIERQRADTDRWIAANIP